MKRIIGLIMLALVGIATSGGGPGAQPAQQQAPDWPDWAYGFLTPLAEGDLVAPPCPLTANPRSCRHPSTAVPDDGIKRTLPDTTASFTRNEAGFGYGPADWYPGDHPPMPDIVAYGNESTGVRACSLCHYPNGQGKMENAHVSGLPAAYILQQLDAFETGDRHNADPRKDNTNEMARMPRGLSDVEKIQIAEYFSSMPFRPWVRVVEVEEAPQVRVTAGGLMIPIEGAPPMRLGQRIIEVPEHPERMEIMRDPRSGFITYVPVGSLAKGEALVTTGDGKTIQCGLCHGPGQKGLGDIPGIAGRTASYTMRQLWDIKQGTRKSPGVMEPVVQNLTSEDMLNIVAYLASLTP
ncbi:MAG: c-type cytochrome [Gammaproteobacteria bacterium]